MRLLAVEHNDLAPEIQWARRTHFALAPVKSPTTSIIERPLFPLSMCHSEMVLWLSWMLVHPSRTPMRSAAQAKIELMRTKGLCARPPMLLIDGAWPGPLRPRQALWPETWARELDPTCRAGKTFIKRLTNSAGKWHEQRTPDWAPVG